MKGHTSYKYSYNNRYYYPLVPIVLTQDENVARPFGLVDSGASISIFKENIAEELGINIEKGEKRTLVGAGGRVFGYKHDIKAMISGVKFTLPVIFSREYKASFNLLGRLGFF